MALMSYSGSSHCIHSETTQCKSRYNGVNSFADKMEAAKTKGIIFGFRPASWSSLKATKGWSLDGSEVGQRRGHWVTVAASPPTEDAVIATEPLTKEELIEELLNGLSERFDWDKIMEGENIIGLQQGKQSISLEPGGQFELSGAPLETLHQTCAEVNSHLYQVKAVAEEMGIGFLGIGFQPKWRREDIPVMPKGRYEIMRNYMPKVGSLGLDMMFRTCTVQVNLDFHSETDMIRKFRAGLALQPIATALFANSPFTEGKPNGFLSMRSQIWTDTDNDRAGMLPFVFDDSFGFEQYVDYALDVPMYFVYRNKKYIDCAGMSFRDFMAGKLPCLPGEYPTLNDWGNHLTTIFPEVRLKRYLEMRVLMEDLGGGCARFLLSGIPAWVGLLYDEVSLQNVLDMTADWTQGERQMLRNKVPKSGLKTPFRDGLLKHVAQEGREVCKGVTPAEKLLALYHGKWGQNVDPVFEELL
ncbi:UNVERIFIED_CONTAM: Glutamate--cysteine ligase, chloroplastic [Sesamum angustifolium]|uniref:Glutamate--cysteine ligase n=1 Tax=Sesamum angustifolium TaxID=2727405 RepID=A0AAW2MI40_9LAMI